MENIQKIYLLIIQINYLICQVKILKNMRKILKSI